MEKLKRIYRSESKFSTMRFNNCGHNLSNERRATCRRRGGFVERLFPIDPRRTGRRTRRIVLLQQYRRYRISRMKRMRL